MCDDKCAKHFGFLVNDVRQSGDVTKDRLCAGFFAINKGTVKAYVNGIPLGPKPDPVNFPDVSGEGVALIGENHEIYDGRITVQFDSSAGDPYVVIVQKYYNA